MCTCVCVYARARVCVCACACMCVRAYILACACAISTMILPKAGRLSFCHQDHYNIIMIIELLHDTDSIMEEI